MKLCQPHVLGRLWSRFTFLGCVHQRNEKLLFRLDSVVHECTTGSVFLLKEIKHHIKTQHILGRKDKNTKRACLIFRNAILSFVSSGIQLARLPSLFKSWRLYPKSIFCYFQGLFLRGRLSLCTCASLNSYISEQWQQKSRSTAGGLINCTQDSANSTGAISPGAAHQQGWYASKIHF